ncbi:MAG: hypothetical protein AB1483_04630 [Candidatus Zixiibacteriota bacterium]
MMKSLSKYFVLSLTVLILLAGCGIVSITYMIDEDFDVSGAGDFYYRAIDVTTNPDWEDHQDDIEFVELVAFDIYLTNNEETAVTFDGYVDEYDDLGICPTRACFDALTTPTRILKDITIPAGSSRHITVGESFDYIENIDVMKALALTGQFNFYGVSTGGSSVNFSVDSGRVIIWLMVSASS